MKYLTYILDKPIQPESFISETKGLKELTTLAVLPAAAVGLVFFGCADTRGCGNGYGTLYPFNVSQAKKAGKFAKICHCCAPVFGP